MSRGVSEHDYIGLSEVTSFEEASNISSKSSKNDLNLKATELRLGLPGSESPKSSIVISGAKRGFSDAIHGGKLLNSPVSSRQLTPSANASSKEQVVGWPPIRSFRKNSMAVITPKVEDDKDCNLESGCLYIKVSMDGAPYLRKVDLKTNGSYMELSSALEKMFSGFTTGQHGHQGVVGLDKITKGRFLDNLHRSEYVLTYEDKDGDWMLVGDVPWKMFMDTCRRLRIMKSSDAAGLASKAATEE